jgi:hypothetical protein
MGNMQYEVELDGSVATGQPNGGFLASFTKLSSKQQHTLVLRSKPQASGDWLALQSAIITAGTGLTGCVNRPFTSSLQHPEQLSRASFASMTKKEDDASWSYGRSYTETTNPVTNTSMRQSSAVGDWAALTFSGHSVMVYGPRYTDLGRYSVTLDGKTQIFNGTSGVVSCSSFRRPK